MLKMICCIASISFGICCIGCQMQGSRVADDYSESSIDVAYLNGFRDHYLKSEGPRARADRFIGLVAATHARLRESQNAIAPDWKHFIGEPDLEIRRSDGMIIWMYILDIQSGDENPEVMIFEIQNNKVVIFGLTDKKSVNEEDFLHFGEEKERNAI